MQQDSPILSNQGSTDLAVSSIAAKAAAKAQRKQIKKAEKERGKLDKKKRKILEKQQQQMKEAETESLDRNTANTEKGNSHIIEESEDDVEIVEDENGQCTVRIKPKPLKDKVVFEGVGDERHVDVV
jgi:hypothetical protein